MTDGKQVNIAQASTPALAVGDDGGRAIDGWFLDDGDLNGDLYLSGESGEVEVIDGMRVHGYFPDTPCAVNPHEKVVFTPAQAENFIALNVDVLKAAAPIRKVTRTEQELVRTAYYRYLCARAGWVSPKFDQTKWNLKYTEAEVVNGIAKRKLTVAEQGYLKKEIRADMRANFTDAICVVAYMFRVRGHHYLDNFEGKMRDMWKKCLKGGENPHLKWEYFAHDATHAIYPMILDEIWKNGAENNAIAGALIKRYDSAPAGVAAIKAVYAGAIDLEVAVPGIKRTLEGHYKELKILIDGMKSDRWKGSVNARYYKAGRLEYNEGQFAALAAAIVAALKQFQSDSPLLRSSALLRVAQGAPISGGVLARAIAVVANSEANAMSMMDMRVVPKD